ncbi:sensor histidine kinase [Hydrogenophaga sp. OTU3427]|uniref:sensor histidine kinase n=1 Tax=Hydrogenophaga sp. OTU3427 TaxID=3043856 RepID=UPI00313D38F6
MTNQAVLPDFRNLGVLLRVALLAELLRLASVLAAARAWADVLTAFVSQGPLFEPTLLTAMAVLALLSPRLRLLSYRLGAAATLGVAMASTVAWYAVVGGWMDVPASAADALRGALLSAMVAGALLFYFNWRHHRQSPAWAESRLMALQSRIRPHFLFNSLNSVLALIRTEPRKAEAMLEDLAELFRALLAEPRSLVPLADELALARAYVAIEGIRLGTRLRVHWHCDETLNATLVPPLLLQPLLENAVRHGAEPLEAGADIRVDVAREGHYLVLTVRNPCPAVGQAQEGNHMALSNIAERLSLHFDAEAQLKTSVAVGEHTARVRLPITGPITR